MKRSLVRSLARSRLSKLSSFTLVELLVVIGIIAILAAVLMSAGNMAIKAALRAKAANTATQIQTACLNYYTEYSVYPVGSATTDGGAQIGDTASSATSWGNLIEALSGNIKPSTGLAATQTAITNSRGIAFLSLRAADVDSSDAPKNPLPAGTGSSSEIYFNIAMDADYDGVLGATPSTAVLPNFASGTTTSLTVTGGSSTAGVAVWANCTGTIAPASGSMSCNANWWVHTY
jgi:prepilin-type N-terminal cleavage/methylation domain-containing protein